MHRQASAAQSTLAQAHGTSSKMRSYFSPWERLTTERPNTMQLARCKMSSQAFSHRGKDLALQRDFWLKPRKPAYPPALEAQLLASGCSSVMDNAQQPWITTLYMFRPEPTPGQVLLGSTSFSGRGPGDDDVRWPIGVGAEAANAGNRLRSQ